MKWFQLHPVPKQLRNLERRRHQFLHRRVLDYARIWPEAMLAALREVDAITEAETEVITRMA